MTLKATPIIGSKGIFTLAAPFDSATEAGVEYTCQAIRRLSDYVAANENPEVLIYKKYSIESQYDADLAANVNVISLQSKRGHWLYVPEGYILDFPSGSGHRYRSVSMVFSLPSIPEKSDLTPLMTEISTLVKARIGVDSKFSVVDTSLPVLIKDESHTQIAIRRALEASSGSVYQELDLLRSRETVLLAKIEELENFIKASQP